MVKKRVQPNESLVSISLEQGVQFDDLMSMNEELIEKRKLANCLLPGDEVEITDTENKGSTLKTSAHNIIEVVEAVYTLPVRIVDDRLKPIEGLEVRLASLALQGPQRTETDSKGIARFELPLTVTKGLLEYVHNEQRTVRPFYCGSLLPPNTTAGVNQRLGSMFGSNSKTVSRRMSEKDILISSLSEEFEVSENEWADLIEGAVS